MWLSIVFRIEYNYMRVNIKDFINTRSYFERVFLALRRNVLK